MKEYESAESVAAWWWDLTTEGVEARFSPCFLSNQKDEVKWRSLFFQFPSPEVMESCCDIFLCEGCLNQQGGGQRCGAGHRQSLPPA